MRLCQKRGMEGGMGRTWYLGHVVSGNEYECVCAVCTSITLRF